MKHMDQSIGPTTAQNKTEMSKALEDQRYSWNSLTLDKFCAHEVVHKRSVKWTVGSCDFDIQS